MPELAAIYALGMLVSALASGLLTLLNVRARRSPKVVRINQHLRSIGFRWSDRQSRIVRFDPEDSEREEAAEFRSALIWGVLSSFASWFGAFFTVLVIVSLRVIARPRLETRVLESRLAGEVKLTPEEILETAADLDPNVRAQK